MMINNTELLETFPEAREIVPKKIQEWKKIKDKIIKNEIKPVINEIEKLGGKIDILSIGTVPRKWFWRTVYLKVLINPKFKETIEHIYRLKKLNYLIHNKDKTTNGITNKDIELARETSIVNTISNFLELKKYGGKYKTNCPFHFDKEPSFFVYPNENSFYCFGCGKGGDIINFVSSYLNVDFKEAVKYLIK